MARRRQRPTREVRGIAQSERTRGAVFCVAPCAYYQIEREVRAGVEPANTGFADRGLTTWLPHRQSADWVVSHQSVLVRVSTSFNSVIRRTSRPFRGSSKIS